MGKKLWLAALASAALLAACQKQKEADTRAEWARPVAQKSTGLEVKDRFGPGLVFPRVPVADYAGNRYDLYNLLNRTHNVVLFVDAFCLACGEEGQKIQKFAQGNPSINIIGVSADSFPAINDLKKRFGLFFPILRDEEMKLVPDYRRVRFPTLVLVGPDKRIVKLYEGEIPADQAQPLLRALFGR